MRKQKNVSHNEEKTQSIVRNIPYRAEQNKSKANMIKTGTNCQVDSGVQKQRSAVPLSSGRATKSSEP